MRIALVPYTRDWSYDYTARALVRHLSDRFDFNVFYNDTLSGMNPLDFDLVVDFWWRGGLDRRFGRRAVKQVSSHRWARAKYGELDAKEMMHAHLRRAGGVLVPSLRLATDLAGAPFVSVCPKGFHPDTFGDEQRRSGSLVVGWAGNAGAPDKRFDVLIAAWPQLRAVGPGTSLGQIDQSAMPDFYNSIDVITCASDAEGDPRPLIEAMACGCFPVTVDVGIVPELVRHGDNGLIVERTPEAFAAAFQWCRDNIDYVRAAGKRNAAEMLRTRTWKQCVEYWAAAFVAAFERAPEWSLNPREERKARVIAIRKRRAALRALESGND